MIGGTHVTTSGVAAKCQMLNVPDIEPADVFRGEDEQSRMIGSAIRHLIDDTKPQCASDSPRTISAWLFEVAENGLGSTAEPRSADLPPNTDPCIKRL